MSEVDDEMEEFLKQISERRERATSLRFDCSRMSDEQAVLHAVSLHLHWPMEIHVASDLSYARIRDAGNKLIKEGRLTGHFCSCGMNGNVQLAVN